MNEHQYIYQNIYSKLKSDILNHHYESHEKLPSKRQMAQDLNVSVNSVKTAYEQLVAEGYIYTIERKGYFIEALSQLIVDIPTPTETHQQWHDSDALAYQTSLSHMSTNIDQFPIHTWTKMQKNAFQQYASMLSEVPHFKGPYPLRKSIAKLVSFKRGILCDPEQIILGSGSISLIQNILQCFESDLTIGIENPGYTRTRESMLANQFHVKPIALDQKGISISSIQNQQVNMIITTPSHQFPTGIIMPISRRIELLNWATQHQSYIIEDDYDSEFKYGTNNIPSLFSLDQNERVIYIGTFSKTLLPGLRISYMILPKHLVPTYTHTFKHSISDMSALNALTLSLFIDHHHYEKYISKMKNIYAQKRKKLIHLLQNQLDGNVRIDNIKAGLHFMVHVDTTYTYQEVEQRANTRHLELYTLNRFTFENLSKCPATTLIIGFSNIPDHLLEESVHILNEVLFGA